MSAVLSPVFAIAVGIAAALGSAAVTPAAAQSFTYNRPHIRPKPAPAA
ncbi:MAG: hypothetical protein JWP84_4391, partial [Tardiphaga sp.]|nr:hypothetical protein [Tardiphaga sp.]